MTRRLPQVTPDECDQITGLFVDRNHAAHTVYTTRILYHGQQKVPVATCPGRHEYGPGPVQPEDPFALLDQT